MCIITSTQLISIHEGCSTISTNPDPLLGIAQAELVYVQLMLRITTGHIQIHCDSPEHLTVHHFKTPKIQTVRGSELHVLVCACGYMFSSQE